MPLTGLSPLAQAISNNEGYGTPAAVTINAYNNPGSIEDGSGNLIQYQSIEDGIAALENQVNKMVYGGSSVYSPDMTIAQAAPIYTGNGPNAAQNWASSLGVSTDTTLGSLQSLQEGSSQNDDTGMNDDYDATDNTPGTSKDTSGGSSNGVLQILQKILEKLADPSFGVSVVFVVLGIVIILVGLFSFKNDGDVIATVRQGASKVKDVAASTVVAAG